MQPYFTFNPLSKLYLFFPGFELFYSYSKDPGTINIANFYDIFDGYYHVLLRFNLTVIKPPGLNPLSAKYL